MKCNNEKGTHLGEYLKLKNSVTFYRRIGDSVFVQGSLLANDERHPHCFAERALEIDPAKRFALKIQYINNTSGTREECWLKRQGHQTAQKVNSVVDTRNDIPGISA